ncbi:MAG: ATP-binding protein, partial [Candidatus Aenigmarchaeota archaeon]|nr:ATP-binding protein [Candidatus Aenigmarchaeota archaeon]
EGGSLFVTITDNGMGVSEKDQKKIFTKFYRTEEAQDLIPYRAGLGLYVTKDVVEKHQGEVSIESKEGKGAAVTIRLPLQK